MESVSKGIMSEGTERGHGQQTENRSKHGLVCEQLCWAASNS
jgi:hypothetical protein